MTGAQGGADAGRRRSHVDGWHTRLHESRRTTGAVQEDTARISAAIAGTGRAVAATLRDLAEEDRRLGRTTSAQRREDAASRAASSVADA